MPDEAEAEFATKEALHLEDGQVFAAEWHHTRARKIGFVAYGFLKRILDFILAAVMLILLSPVLLVASIAIKLDSPGPVLFRQERTGRNGKIFRILKFRSMAADNDVHDNTCDDQYTKVGSILRRTSLDELPQLFNVLVGQMSFIGPRPWIPDYWDNMGSIERIRGRVRPGITGLAAAKGRNGLTVFQKIAYDLEYVRNYSLRQDLKVIIMTVRTVFDKDVVDAGKGGIHNDVEDLKREDKGPKIRIILKDDPLVSVVVALDNGEDYIMEVVSSALGKTVKSMELVAMNDGYSQKARRTLAKFSRDRINVVKKQDGKGAKIGLEGNAGRFWCFIDIREAWRPSKIIEQLALAQNLEPAEPAESTAILLGEDSSPVS